MSFVIYHNPACGTSRNTLQMIRDSGEEPVVIEYMKSGWTREQLLGLFAAADITPRQALRIKQSIAIELELTGPETTDDQILDAMVEHPVLVERPIVCGPKGVRLCRPSELVFELLDSEKITTFTKEDGQVVKPGK